MRRHELDTDSDEARARLRADLAGPDPVGTVFRPARSVRVLTPGLSALIMALMLINVIEHRGDGRAGLVLACASLMAIGFLAWRVAFVQRIVFERHDLVVIDVFRRFRIPWTAVVIGSCWTGGQGTSVSYRTSDSSRVRTVRAFALATTPVGRWPGKDPLDELPLLVDRAAATAQGLLP